MIAYCAISYYLAAVLSTDTLNWFPNAFISFHGWDAEVADLCWIFAEKSNTSVGVQ